jgi:Holliday junction DNA helicase RuvB
VAELERVVTRGANLLGIGIEAEAPMKSPDVRAARRALPDACCAVCAISRKWPAVRQSPGHCRQVLTRLEVDKLGLDLQDRRYLMMIADIYKGGPSVWKRSQPACPSRATPSRK